MLLFLIFTFFLSIIIYRTILVFGRDFYISINLKKILKKITISFCRNVVIIYIYIGYTILSSLLFLANIYNRSVHLQQVCRGVDIKMIVQAKAMGVVNVSCDINPLFLVFGRYFYIFINLNFLPKCSGLCLGFRFINGKL